LIADAREEDEFAPFRGETAEGRKRSATNKKAKVSETE